MESRFKAFQPVEVFTVFGVDQRCAGKSEPNAGDPLRYPEVLSLFKDITIEKMSQDFETVRTAVGVHKWMLFGGSWGATLGLQYLLDFPNSVIAQATRGISLGTAEQRQDVFAMSSIRKYSFPDRR